MSRGTAQNARTKMLSATQVLQKRHQKDNFIRFRHRQKGEKMLIRIVHLDNKSDISELVLFIGYILATA